MLNYQEILPHIHLTAYIKCYWQLQPLHPFLHQSYWILADSYPDIIINLNTHKVYLVGTMTRPIHYKVDEQTHLLGIRLLPWALAAFLRLSLSEITDKVVEVNDLDSGWLRQIKNLELRQEASFGDNVRKIEQYLLSHLSNRQRVDKRVIGATQLIEQSKGKITTKQLAQECSLSMRQLERYFQEVVGVSPKTLTRLARFRSVCQLLMVHTSLPLAEIAFRSGYYDLSHLIHDFKTFAGYSPSTFPQNTMSFFYNC